MKEKLRRKMGFDIMGGVPWGTHLCQFYQTKGDLIDILVPYFKAGLENNEFCMWVTSGPLSEEEAKDAMKRALSDFDQYLRRGQIEILPHDEWYLKDGVFNLQGVLNRWVDKLSEALAKGYDGMRVTGNTAWLERRDWKSFSDYEEEINNVIGKHRMIAICSYPIDKCGATEAIDVVSNHQFALIKRESKWDLIESSEHKRAVEALKESEERYRILIENSPDAIALIDLNLNIIMVNQGALRLFGYESAEEVIGKNALDFIASEDRPRAVKDVRKIFETGAFGDIEYTMLKKDGTCFSTELRGSLVMDPGGKPKSIICVVRDITARKYVEKTLQESEEKYRLLVDHANEAIFIVQEGVIKFPNPVTLVKTRYSAEELAKINFVNLIHSEDRDAVLERCKKRMNGEKIIGPHSFRIINRDDEELWVQMNDVLITWEGRPATLIIVRDLSSQKKMEDQIQQARKMQAVGTMIAGLAHELKNPLAVISSCAQFCMENMDPTTPMRENLLMIYQNSKRANKLIINFLQFAKSYDLKWRPVNINEVVTRTWSMAALETNPFSISFGAQLEEKLPEIMGDPEKLEQVFLNLFLNAIQAVSKKGKVIVQTRFLVTENMVEVKVIDDGPGIPKERRHRIFDPFFTTKEGGTGLGLNLCYFIIEGHKGSIAIDYEGERGTKVSVRLPATQDERANDN